MFSHNLPPKSIHFASQEGRLELVRGMVYIMTHAQDSNAGWDTEGSNLKKCRKISSFILNLQKDLQIHIFGSKFTSTYIQFASQKKKSEQKGTTNQAQKLNMKPKEEWNRNDIGWWLDMHLKLKICAYKMLRKTLFKKIPISEFSQKKFGYKIT